MKLRNVIEDGEDVSDGEKQSSGFSRATRRIG